MPPKVSIIIPVYNAGKYLVRCLDSLVNQTMTDIEIILILDKPTDGSDLVAEEYSHKDKRIKIIANEKNLHIGCSRNVGLKAAQGEYVGLPITTIIANPKCLKCCTKMQSNLRQMWL